MYKQNSDTQVQNKAVSTIEGEVTGAAAMGRAEMRRYREVLLKFIVQRGKEGNGETPRSI